MAGPTVLPHPPSQIHDAQGSMSFARPVVFGNWKMNGLREPSIALARSVAARAGDIAGTLGIFPPSTVLHGVADAVRGAPLLVGAQDCHFAQSGAFTGSISASMVRDAGAGAVIIGHSERRHGLGETDELVCAKLEAAQAEDLIAVVCIGESEEQYLGGLRDEVLASQIERSLPSRSRLDKLVVAYEPVWAIGTGRTPKIEEIQDAHSFIRGRLGERFADAGSVPILYGGSVKPDNAAEIMKLDAIDGVLVGGASLHAEGFLQIARLGRAS
jgi:triosephosphate isomerase (TIM)